MARKSRKHPRFVAVHWLDAAGDHDGADEELEPIDAVTFGFLLANTERADGEKFVRVASEIFDDGTYRSVTSIPMGMVRTIIACPVKLPENFRDWQPKKS